jgi:hypothetical protein
MQQPEIRWMYFHWIWYWGALMNRVDTFQFLLKADTVKWRSASSFARISKETLNVYQSIALSPYYFLRDNWTSAIERFRIVPPWVGTFPNLLRFRLVNGASICEGISGSTLGGAVWFDLLVIGLLKVSLNDVPLTYVRILHATQPHGLKW